MRLLILTQIVDRDDPVLGFFHSWIEELALKYKAIHVICLKEGNHSLPDNVRVHSLGKEKGGSKFLYALHFLSYCWKLRKGYDAVFVHMNQEYILIGGWLWKLLHKPVYLWRNHYAGSYLTDLAAAFCTKVFCTSRFSYTAKYAKTVLMPVGVDLSLVSSSSATTRKPSSILFLGRLAPSKRVEVFIQALSLLKERGIQYSASIYGAALNEHAAYEAALHAQVKKKDLEQAVSFCGGVSHEEVGAVYASHEIFVNLSTSGMFDKTLFEAAAAGCAVVATSKDFEEASGVPSVPPEAIHVAKRLEILLSNAAELKETAARDGEVVERNSLKVLVTKIYNEVSI